MFTGLVEEVGRVRRVERRGSLLRLEIGARRVLEDLRAGDSINLDGACQTAVEVAADGFWVESVAETLARTTLGQFRCGRRVNLERALRLGGRLGGHLLQGHVDGVGRIAHIEGGRGEWRLRIAAAADLRRYIASKGSVAVDGISLTVAAVDEGGFTIAVIPHTFDNTTLAQRQSGDAVNIEVDVIARYVETLLAGRAPEEGLSFAALRRMGY